jgi:exosortase family protein XrtM
VNAKGHNFPLRFGLSFIITFAILTGAFEAARGSAFERFVVEDILLMPTNRVINFLSPMDHVELTGRSFVSGAYKMHVIRGCEGIEMFLLLSAAIIAFPATTARRLWGLAIGFVLAYALSVARLTALVYTLRHAPDAWESLHGLILPLAPVIVIAWYFLLWSAASGGQNRAARTADAA